MDSNQSLEIGSSVSGEKYGFGLYRISLPVGFPPLHWSNAESVEGLQFSEVFNSLGQTGACYHPHGPEIFLVQGRVTSIYFILVGFLHVGNLNIKSIESFHQQLVGNVTDERL